MDYKSLSNEIIDIKNDFEKAFRIFKNDELFKKTDLIYTQSDKTRLRNKWINIKVTFQKLKKLNESIVYKSYLSLDFNYFLFKYYLVNLYYDNLYKINKTFGIHEDFVRQQLDEKFRYNYNSIARYMYRFKFLYFLNYHRQFVLMLKNSVDENFSWIIEEIEKQKSSHFEKRLFLDSVNIIYHIKYKFLNLLYFLVKHIGLLASRITLTTRKNGLISKDSMDEYLKIAMPGDILLTRTNWVGSNISIPGFWKHMSMYIGTGKYLKQKFRGKFNDIDLDKHYIIEAVGGGVRVADFGLLCKHNDYLCALRPRFSDDKKHRAIKSAISNLGKKYDFLFNYHSDKSFVCSELITKSYLKEDKNDEGLTISLEKISVGITYPPNNLVMKLDIEHRIKNRELDPIIFIDSIEKEKKNFVNTSKKDLYESWKRSRLTMNLK